MTYKSRGNLVRPKPKECEAAKVNVCRVCGLDGLDVEESEEAADSNIQRSKYYPTEKKEKTMKLHIYLSEICAKLVLRRGQRRMHIRSWRFQKIARRFILTIVFSGIRRGRSMRVLWC